MLIYMKICFEDNDIIIETSVSIIEFFKLNKIDINNKRVYLNGNLLDKKTLHETILRDGDRIDTIRFMIGG